MFCMQLMKDLVIFFFNFKVFTEGQINICGMSFVILLKTKKSGALVINYSVKRYVWGWFAC